MYKAIIFDFFGLFCPDITMNWFQKTIPGHKEKLSDFQAICTRSDYGKLSRWDFYKEVAALANVPVDEMIKGVEAETIVNVPLVDHVKGLKKDGYQTACLSNGTHEWTLAVINDHGLGILFDGVILYGDLGIVKPNPKSISTHWLNLTYLLLKQSLLTTEKLMLLRLKNAASVA